jgi:uncharacterized protein (DUF1015 family)
VAKIFPFRALHYALNKNFQLDQLLTPPYDVISVSDKKKYERSNPYNVIRLILGNPSYEHHHPHDYQNAKKTFSNWIKNKILTRDVEKSIYIYRQTFNFRNEKISRTGFISTVLLPLINSNHDQVLAHERTLEGPKADRLKLMKSCKANFSSIFSLYNDDHNISGFLSSCIENKKPDMKAYFPKETLNQIWKVSDRRIIKKLQLLMKRETLFIADGHHRYETAKNYQIFRSKRDSHVHGQRPYDYTMMMFVSMKDPGLLVLPTHRMVLKNHKIDSSNILFQLQKLGSIETYPVKNYVQVEKKLHECGIKSPAIGFSFNGKRIYILKFYEKITSECLSNISSAQKKLDVTLLQNLILSPILGIDSSDIEHSLRFTSDFQDVLVQLKQKKTPLAFFLNPVKLSQLKEIAMLGEKMPQKSTFFYPKLITGLLFNDLNSF